jgi:hypothetical protein
MTQPNMGLTQITLGKQNMSYPYADGDAFYAVMARHHAFYRTLIQNLGLKGQ